MFRRILKLKTSKIGGKLKVSTNRIAPLLSPNDGKLGNMFNIDNVNKWVSLANDLGPVRDSIKNQLSKEKLDDKDMYHSIPNVFAQLALNEIVLRDPAHPLHSQFIASWRACFTMIMLKDEFALDLDEDTIDLSKIDEASPIFSYVAKTYIDILNKNEEEKNVITEITMYLCKVEDAADSDARFPLALYTPRSIICPAKEFSGRIIDAPPFIKHKPVDINGKKVRLTAKEEGKPQLDIDGKPVYWVVEFQDPVAYLNENPLLSHKLSRYLTKANELYPGNAFITAFITDLASSAAAASRTNPLLAGSPMITQLKLDDDDPWTFGLNKGTVFNNHICLLTSEDLDNFYGSYDFKGDLKDGVALIPLKDNFISKHLSPVMLGNNFKQTLEQLKHNFCMRHEQGNDDSPSAIIAELVHNGYTFMRRYPKRTWIEPDDWNEHGDPRDQGDPGDSNIPPIAIWPSKIDPMGLWKTYYTFQSTSTTRARKGLVFTPIIDSVADRINEYEEGKGRERYCVKQATSFPYFLSATLHNKEPAGVLIVKPHPDTLPDNRDKHLIIGVDFGTTSTISYMTDVYIPAQNALPDVKTPTEMTFGEESVLYVSSADDCEFLSTHLFFPKKTLSDAKASFYTLLYKRSPVVSPTPKLEPKEYSPVLHTNMLLARSFTDEDRVPVEEFANSVETSLKWWSGESDSIYSGHFISQFLMMCMFKALERGAKCIYWRCAYPFSLQDSRQYVSMFTEAIRNAKKETGLHLQDGKILEKEIEHATESYAAGLHFKSRYDVGDPFPVNIEKGYVTIDIGGGSTDISIWQRQGDSDDDSDDAGNNPLSCSSIRFAGEEIISHNIDRMSENKRLELKKTINVSGANTFASSDAIPEPFRLALLNMALANIPNKEAMDSLLNTNRSRDPIRTMVKIFRFNLYSFIAYAGHMLKQLIASKCFEIKSDGIDVVLCGNGTKIIWWEPDVSFRTQLAKIFIKAAGIPDTCKVEIIDSDKHKGEVAYGLVSKPSLPDPNTISNSEFSLTYPSNFKDDIASMFSVLTQDIKAELDVGQWRSQLPTVKQDMRTIINDSSSFVDAYVVCLELLNKYFH